MSSSIWRIGKDEAIGDRGMVAAKHPLAVGVGLDVLKRGGNAVDAAVSMAFALGVVEPASGGLGGGGMMLIHQAGTGRTVAIDYAMDAPLAAGPATFELDAEGGAGPYGWPKVKDDANAVGYRAASVPGMVRGMELALGQFGTISLDGAIAPAIRFAEEGVSLDWLSALRLGSAMRTLSRFPATARIFLPGGFPIPPMDGGPAPARLVQSDLAATLRLIARDGAAAFYRGPIARDIAGAMRENGGLISEEDLARYQATLFEDPIATDYRGDRVFAVPGACGGITALQALNVMEGFDLRSAGAGSLLDLHLQAEAFRGAFADRYRYVADPKQVAVPWKGLLARDYARARRDLIRADRAAAVVEPGDPWTFDDSGPGPARADTSAGRGGSGGSTTHLAVADRQGNVVALTQTLVNNFGSGVVVAGTGVLLNNAMAWFDLVPGRPNSLASGKRGLNNMSPLLILRDGRPFLAIGATGGRRIIQAVTQVLLNVVDHGMSIQDAVAAPRIDCSGPVVLVDSRVPAAVCSALEARGHRVRVAENLFTLAPFALPLGILVEPGTGRFHAGVDPFRPAFAEGF
ncbi:MAG TPA: gamma-glutamyltransferase [Chloroflexota bacterium]|nr:gamma-glutamyltransferase [Chloroflexota bacterium]